MFDRFKKLFDKGVPTEAIGEPSAPGKEVQFRAWVVLEDGRVAYIDHYKSDGKFGVRPVNYDTGRHFPNLSQHWTNEQRLKAPEELALSFGQMREATEAEIPMMYRKSQ